MNMFQRILQPQGPKDKSYYTTGDFPLAVLILSQGCPIVRVEQRRKQNYFTFRNSFHLQEIVDRFQRGRTVYVDVHRIFSAWRYLRDRLDGEGTDV